MKTKVINTSGVEGKHFAFLPPHGRDMGNNEEVEFDGDLRSVIASGRNRYSRAREIAALDAACAGGDLCLVELVEDCCSSSSA